MSKLVFTKQHEQFASLIDEAMWSLTDTDIAKIVPGSNQSAIDQLDKLINVPELLTHPFSKGKFGAYSLDRPDLALLKVLSDPEYFSFACYHLFSLTGGEKPLRLDNFQCVVLQEFWWRQFPMLVCTRGFSKSFLLALYIILRLTFQPGCQMAIVAKTLRQAQLVWNYCSVIWDNSPVFRDLVGRGNGSVDNGPRRGGNDRCEFRIGDSIALFLPLGPTGETIRGIRAQYVLTDEFACLAPETLIETNKGIMTIKECGENLDGLTLRQPNGIFLEPSKFIQTKPIDTYRVMCVGGYEFTCSPIHQVMTTKGWKLAKDLTNNDRLIQERTGEFGKYYINDEETELVLDEELGWLFGALVSEGAVNDKYSMTVQSTDLQLVDRVAKIFGKISPNSKITRCNSEGHVDSRGWVCKEKFVVSLCSKDIRNAMERLGLKRTNVYGKEIPNSILLSPESVIKAFLSGLFDGDGTMFVSGNHAAPPRLKAAYYSVSERLVTQVQHLLLKFGVMSHKCSRTSKLSEKLQWMITAGDTNAEKLSEIISVPRFEKVIIKSTKVKVRDGAIYCKNINKWAARGYDRDIGKTVSYGVYATREEAAEVVAKNKILSIGVKSVTLLPEKQVLYDFEVPESRMFLGNGFVQHNSISEDVYAVVVQGFGAVSNDPVAKASRSRRERILKRLGAWTNDLEADSFASKAGNQSILSGTASYQFNHFYRYWKDYHDVLLTKGDPRKIEDHFGGKVPKGFDWRRYSIIRVPYDMIPHGYMDEATISRAEQISSTANFAMEYGASFLTDSDGFFRRSIIERATIGGTDDPLPSFASCGEVDFGVLLFGDKGLRYVYGVDPALQSDNFAVVIIEVHPDHRRVVYCWTTNKADHRAQRSKKGAAPDFYKFCIRKLREMFTKWPPAQVLIDAGSGGGGHTLVEAFSDPDKLEEGERCVYEVIEEGVIKDTDHLAGDHIIKLIQFSKNSWVVDANWSLKKDMEDRVLLFPRIDEMILGLAMEEDIFTGRSIKHGDKVETIEDTLESALSEIDELKNELTVICHVHTASGQEKWDTPENKALGSKRGPLKKDRYSALLMCNWGARNLLGGAISVPQPVGGGFARGFKKPEHTALGGGMYRTGSDRIANMLRGSGAEGYGVIKKK